MKVSKSRRRPKKKVEESRWDRKLAKSESWQRAKAGRNRKLKTGKRRKS